MSRRQNAVLLAVFFEGGLAVVAWILGFVLGRSPLAGFRWDLRHLIWGLVACLPMLAVFLAGLRSRWRPLARIRQFLDEVIGPLFGQCSIAELALISLLAGIGEEMLFRGLLQWQLSAWGGPAFGLAAASVLFGLAHLITPTYAAVATLIGVYLGWLWQLHGNLLVPIVAHAGYDFVALVWLLRVRSFVD